MSNQVSQINIYRIVNFFQCVLQLKARLILSVSNFFACHIVISFETSFVWMNEYLTAFGFASFDHQHQS